MYLNVLQHNLWIFGAAASLRSIQEQEKVGHARQAAQAPVQPPPQVASPGAPGGRGPGWNVPQVQAKPLKDIMQETAQNHMSQPRPSPAANVPEFSR